VDEIWFQIRVSPPIRSLVVFDVSAAAAPFWANQIKLVQSVAEIVPPTEHPEIGFLGSTARAPLGQFLQSPQRWYAAHAGRGRVISPLFESFRENWPARVLVCASRPPVDLLDWRQSPHAHRVAVIGIDPADSSGGVGWPTIAIDDPRAAGGLLTRRPRSAHVKVPGGFPIAWDNPHYRVAAGGLVLDGMADPEIRVGFLCGLPQRDPTAHQLWQDDTTTPLSVEVVPSPEPSSWQPMTPLELAVLDAWRDGRAARCGHCGQLHQPGEVACADGVWALPSLASGEPGGFARVQVSTFQARYQAVRGPAIGVAHSVIVVRDPPGSSPVVWRFDGAREEWARTGETWARFEPIGSADLFVLALPPAGRGPA